MTTGRDRHNLAIGIRKTRLISACAALAGVGAEDVKLRDLVLAREQDAGQRLRRALIGAVTAAGDKPLSRGEFEMPEAIENDFTSLLAARLVPAVRRASDGSPFRVDALRVVRAAIATAEALPAPSLAELCGAEGVGQRWLHRSFVDILGESPYRYIRLARLSKARELLLLPEAKPAVVKTVSLSLGYCLSGRFAADYRSVFGETPRHASRIPNRLSARRCVRVALTTISTSAEGLTTQVNATGPTIRHLAMPPVQRTLIGEARREHADWRIRRAVRSRLSWSTTRQVTVPTARPWT